MIMLCLNFGHRPSSQEKRWMQLLERIAIALSERGLVSISIHERKDSVLHTQNLKRSFQSQNLQGHLGYPHLMCQIPGFLSQLGLWFGITDLFLYSIQPPLEFSHSVQFYTWYSFSSTAWVEGFLICQREFLNLILSIKLCQLPSTFYPLLGYTCNLIATMQFHCPYAYHPSPLYL